MIGPHILVHISFIGSLLLLMPSLAKGSPVDLYKYHWDAHESPDPWALSLKNRQNAQNTLMIAENENNMVFFHRKLQILSESEHGRWKIDKRGPWQPIFLPQTPVSPTFSNIKKSTSPLLSEMDFYTGERKLN
jgi:hypothetical protein